MNAKDQIRKFLQNTANTYSVSFTYEFDGMTDMHVIEIAESEILKNDRFIEEKYHFTMQFDSEFFPESILFVHSDSLTHVLNPELTIIPYFIEYPRFEHSVMPKRSWTIEASKPLYDNSIYALAA